MIDSPEAAALALAPLPPIAPGDDVPFYYASLVVCEVLYLADPGVLAPFLAGSGLQLARFEDGRGCVGFNFQMYTSQFSDSMGQTMEIELNVLGLPEGHPAPQVTFNEWVLGMDQGHTIGNHRVHVPCDDPIAIEAGERKFGEPKFFTQFLPDIPSINGPASELWSFTCCDPAHPPGPDGKDADARAHAIFACSADLARLDPVPSYPVPITEYGTVTAPGPDHGKLIGARWNIFGAWQTYLLDRSASTRVELGYGESAHPMQSDMKALIGDAPAVVVRTFSSLPCSAQARTFWP